MKEHIKVKYSRQHLKETFRHNVIAIAHKIINDQGLEALSMRAIATQLGCSQSKIYEVFKDKDHLCETLCGDLSEFLLSKLKKVKMSKKYPEDYLRNLFAETLVFHETYPHSDSLFTLVCYGGSEFNLPAAFQEIEALFIVAIKKLESPILNSDEKIVLALNAIRFLFIGASQINIFGKRRAKEIAENALDNLIRGWTK